MHQRFVGFLGELDAEFSDLPLYTSIRWLSAGKILKHFFGMCKEILSFFKNNLWTVPVIFEHNCKALNFFAG